jgi:hypothetical protein
MVGCQQSALGRDGKAAVDPIQLHPTVRPLLLVLGRYGRRRGHTVLGTFPAPKPVACGEFWRSSCQHKHKVFFFGFSLMTDSVLEISSEEKNMFLQSYNCVLCNLSVEESVEHLFLHCEFAKTCWNLLGLVVPSSLDPFQNMEHFKAQLKVSFFMEIIILLCWSIWSVTNNYIFRAEEPSRDQCKFIFKNVFRLVILRAKKKYLPNIETWLERNL